MAEFSELGLPKSLVKRLNDMGLKEATPIQNRAIPHALNGEDVMGLAQTGTGKTLAFGLPLISRLQSYGTKPADKTARALILAPTRELANQIVASLKALVEGTHFKVGLVVGGVAINPQIKRVSRGTDIIVATPGRLLDLMERNALDLEATDFLVLDEADQMLDLGFIHALRQISSVLPEERQTMLFSATMPKQMAEIAQTYLTNPVRIQVNPPGKAADKITQSIHFIAKAEKPNLLIELLDAHRDEAAIVFVRTKHGADRLMKSLQKAGYAADAVHGNKSQGQRERAIAAFRAEETRVLVATDVAARGLDIPIVRHVYNFDLPNVPDNYVHRIGRTARAGMDGAAVAFCAPDEVDELKAIQKTMKFTIPVASGRPWEGAEIEKRKPSGGGGRRRGGGGGGGRRFGGGGRPGGKSSEGQSAGGRSGEGNSGGGKPGCGRPGGKPGGFKSRGGKPGGGKPGGGGSRRGGPSRGRRSGGSGGGGN
ncbi:MAG: DEAD/DEAH box helicase [Cognatishimia sp.]|uniref:DEAD/DEAH box helicase n=1 Tax=Cognatishimia sp. TaxID=2211648 RepID=UPI003B8C37F2